MQCSPLAGSLVQPFTPVDCNTLGTEPQWTADLYNGFARALFGVGLSCHSEGDCMCLTMCLSPYASHGLSVTGCVCYCEFLSQGLFVYVSLSLCLSHRVSHCVLLKGGFGAEITSSQELDGSFRSR